MITQLQLLRTLLCSWLCLSIIDGLSAVERANLVVCIKKLHDAGVSVTSLTCDGPSCHFSMMSTLGASLDHLNLQSCFPHPLQPGKKEWLHVLLDVCHMLKFTRNILGEGGILVHKEGGRFIGST